MEAVLEFYLATVEANRRKNKRIAAILALSQHDQEDVDVREFVMD